MNPKPDSPKPNASWGARPWTPQGERLFIGSSSISPSEQVQTVANENGPMLERELLLAEGAADPRERPHRASTRRTGWIAALALVLIAGALAAVAFLRERASWSEARAVLEDRLAKLSEDSSQKIEALRREAAEKSQQLSERRAENQSLAQLADKTLNQLQACLGDLRHERERNEKLQTECKKALEISRPTLNDAIAEWLPQWVRAIKPEKIEELEKKEPAGQEK